MAPLALWFDRLQITTARPWSSERPGKPTILPLSTAVDQNRRVDLALQPNSDDLLRDRAATFAPDWKGDIEEQLKATFDAIETKQELRVRTAIDSSQRRAKKSSLFAYHCVTLDNAHVWRGSISFDARESELYQSPVPEAKQANAAIEMAAGLLSTGWLSVGKTRARGTGKLVAFSPTPAEAIDLTEDENARGFVVTLRSATIMVDPRTCVDARGDMKSSSEIDKLYQDYWQEVSEGLLEEIPDRRFKRDGLIGGYQAWRYRFAPNDTIDLRQYSADEAIARQKAFPYAPTLVVEAGSVFVLRICSSADETRAVAVVQRWFDHGLPLPQWACKAYGNTHYTNIFLPQNGFGEIDVNLPCQTTSRISPLSTNQDASHA